LTSWENDWNVPAGRGPFKFLIANVKDRRRHKQDPGAPLGRLGGCIARRQSEAGRRAVLQTLGKLAVLLERHGSTATWLTTRAPQITSSIDCGVHCASKSIASRAT
jgi:hypothetical protein